MGDLNIITEADRYVFGKGCHYEIYRKLGSHLMELGGKKEYILRYGRRMRMPSV